MREIELWTLDRNFVAIVEIPPFPANHMPPVVFWGNRVFSSMPVEQGVHDDARPLYVEVFAVASLTSPGAEPASRMRPQGPPILKPEFGGPERAPGVMGAARVVLMKPIAFNPKQTIETTSAPVDTYVAEQPGTPAHPLLTNPADLPKGTGVIVPTTTNPADAPKGSGVVVPPTKPITEEPLPHGAIPAITNPADAPLPHGAIPDDANPADAPAPKK